MLVTPGEGRAVSEGPAGEEEGCWVYFQKRGVCCGSGAGGGRGRSSPTGGGWESHGWTDSHKEKVGDFLKRIFLLDFDLPKEGGRSRLYLRAR